MKKFLRYAFVAVFVSIAGYSVYASQKSDAMSDFMLANVEALALGEDSACPNGCVDNGDGCSCNGVHCPAWKGYGSR